MSDQPFRIVFAIFDGMTQLDFTGPYQLFTLMPNATIAVASLHGGDVVADKLTFGGTTCLSDIEACDLICVPGGPATMDMAAQPSFLAEIARLASTAQYITSVCSGSLILAAAGLLRGRRAACHWASRKFLSYFGALPENARVVTDGNIITGGGVTAGIDFALSVIREVRDEETARFIQLAYEYAPMPPFNSGHPDEASDDLVQRYQAVTATTMAHREIQVRLAAGALATK